MWTLIPEDVEIFIMQVEKERRPKENLRNTKFNMLVDESYLNELLKYDFTSTKRGKGYSSLFVQRKQKQGGQSGSSINPNAQEQQIPNNQNDVLHAPTGVMDVKHWYNRLTPAQRAAYERGLKGESGNKSDAEVLNRSHNHVNGF